MKVPGVRTVKRYVFDKPAPGVPKVRGAVSRRVSRRAVEPGVGCGVRPGDWKSKIRPHMFNRVHVIYKAVP